ncbi:MAG TPA: 4-hydroxy-3-methylbut-2-enyl diphosphate reductase [Nitrospirae bacterium]|nr:4-hydroxy-3-methylbut-2-enyl diphosphate reductase [bacterium BMS3Abin10]GBE37627.1 4-hydroxy-3-methylbut-2-enyl diphosphate reductase [bacterium BMS3Bbin08]HDK16703.1 4-hydroxy-3-methylbut-2-enyl diphosphate reductase [Nitrospirota bacterium]HDK81170.1 4-hydroxy-3-methylbut-2-enyl diphosphate reductase [Nitrospirota bacterium]
MEILICKRAGFCFGVKRAIDIAFDLARNRDGGVYSFGPLIHNPQVIEELRSKGIAPIDDIHSPGIKTLIVRTHGISPSVYDEISGMDYELVDATCPFVKKAQQHAQTLKEEGYKILILGDKKHPEVQALLGFAGDNVITVSGSDPIPALKGKVGIIVQTTQPVETLKKRVCGILDTAKEVKVYNTICDSTSLMLDETKKLAGAVDLMIVVGGKNSANTTQLTVLAKGICDKVYHIETSDELIEEWFKDVKKAGITGGASTPRWIIDDVAEKLRKISGKT